MSEHNRINLLAEGHNQLKVGDKVRLRSGTIRTITSTTSDYQYGVSSQPIESACVMEGERRSVQMNWGLSGAILTYRHPAVKDNSDIVGIIRPGRVTPITESTDREYETARTKQMLFLRNNGADYQPISKGGV